MKPRAALAMGALALGLWAEHPLIHTLSTEDCVFRQLADQIREGYAAEMSVIDGVSDLCVYRYILEEKYDIFSLAAKVNLPYESISTLNRLAHPGPYSVGQSILIPSRPGLFLPESPSSELEALSLSWRSARPEASIQVTIERGGGKVERMAFVPAGRFLPEERAYFLNGLFRFPLPAGKLVSGFGYRVSPISGEFKHHSGVDLAAPAGTDVLAARDGVVAAAGWDDVLGRYVSLDHGDGYTSVYGHLSAIGVSLSQRVKSGIIIGKVGSTGKSTGPHLHFEIRSRGEAVDPAAFIPRVKR